jgi:hypothetical protein
LIFNQVSPFLSSNRFLFSVIVSPHRIRVADVGSAICAFVGFEKWFFLKPKQARR